MNYSEIRDEARSYLEGYWKQLALVWFYFLFGAWLLSYGLSFYFRYTFLIYLVIIGPFALGVSNLFLKIYRRETFEVKELLEVLPEFFRAMKAFLLIVFYVIAWSILLIVPGIVEALSLSMTFFIMAEEPEITPEAAVKKSRELMKGNKKDLFYLTLSFIGWILLAFFICGLGFLLLNSYVGIAYLLFYKRIVREKESWKKKKLTGKSIVIEGW